MNGKTQGANPPWARLRTPAKVSLSLQVFDLRKDGYHGVRLVLVPVSLYDTLRMQHAPGIPLSLEVDSAEDLGAVENNLVWRAACRFEEASGVALQGKIRLTKRIPSGAGLGGGSGNAAGTLVALNALHGFPLSPPALLAAAAALGSDVPFFVAPRPSVCEGRGEVLSPLAAVPPLALLVAKPRFSIATGAAYRALAESRAGRPAPVPAPLPDLTTVDAVAAALHNDFEPVLDGRYPELAELRAQLSAAGALGAVLTGSGSAVFGVFRGAPQRDRAAERLGRDGRWTLLPCETLAGHSYDFES
jgi:4-diphosphocytidyl-2-C-methyl-D-erythritol kinase